MRRRYVLVGLGLAIAVVLRRSNTAPRPAPALANCAPSAYHADGWSIGGVIPFVFPACPTPELDLDVSFCADCPRPCGYTRETSIDGEPGIPVHVGAGYDRARRLITLSTMMPQRFAYDTRSRLATWWQLETEYALDRDAHGRIVRVRKLSSDPGVWEFRYRADGLVQEAIDPYGSTLRFIYDRAGRQVAEDDNGARAEFRYDKAGRLVYRGTTWKETLRYDRRGRLASITSATTKRRSNFVYAANQLEKVVQVDDTGRLVTTTTYDYCE